MANPFPPFQELTSQDFQNYQDALADTSLQDPTGTLFEAAFASQKDWFSDIVRLSLKARLPQLGAPDALTQIGVERSMPQGQSESGIAYGSRLQDAWNAWPWGGTAFGLLRAFYSTGYTNVVLGQVRGGKVFTLDNGGVNYLQWSQDRSLAPWTVQFGGTGVNPIRTPNAGTAPDGTTTATRVKLDRGAGTSGADISRVYQPIPSLTVGQNYTFDLWLKSFTGSTFTVAIEVFAGLKSIVTVNNTWQRFSVSGAAAVTPQNGAMLTALGTDGTSQAPDLLVWGDQVEPGTLVGPYSWTGSATKTTTFGAGVLVTTTLGTGLWETDPLSAFSPANQTFWSKFDVVFPLPLNPPNFTWSGGIPASNSAESNFIRALIQAWKPGHATCNAIKIQTQGQLLGYPAARTLGASNGLVGGTSTVWTP